MTGAEHYEAAEHLLADAAALRITDPPKSRMLMAAAHTHAIQAQTAALVAIHGGNMALPVADRWELVTGEPVSP